MLKNFKESDCSRFYELILFSLVVLFFILVLRNKFDDHLKFKIFLRNFNSPIINQSRNLNLLNVILNHCPSIFGTKSKFFPTLWLFSGHLQTIYSAFGDFSKIDEIDYQRKLIKLPDGGQLALDLTPPDRFSTFNDSTPVLIVLHGLTGGSHESYVRSVLSPLINRLGWRAVVANFRGCAGSKLTSQILYNAGATEDLRVAIRFLKQTVCPQTPLHAIGFSLGANVLAKYLGEVGEDCPISSAVVVGNPWDLYAGHCFLESNWIKRIYSRALASNLRSMFSQHLNIFKTPSGPIDLHALISNPSQSLYEFDSIVTRVLGNYPSTEAYYKSQSSIRFAGNIRIPLLSINALDDPIVTIDAVPIESVLENPYLVILISSHGGHLGWFEGLWKPTRMISRPILEWFQAMDLVLEPHLKTTSSFDMKEEPIETLSTTIIKSQGLKHPPGNQIAGL
ncbi:hypothetical protein O181_016682 [Austropuccinia psidii MF-1]|uniref:AB hydrolase-1 domain-containing protein n=1 Tax=Austropuccinia psidii MF-1 TaxID=1389203 RepID=A0A9Q3GRX1_9BASI|nr:hypothetical protein [Austropuccinia psidii MF-1]